MKKLKLMLKSGYSIDAIFELRKTPIIISLIFGIFLSMMQMTPFAWRAKPEVWETLAGKTTLDCQTDFSIHVWQRLN